MYQVWTKEEFGETWKLTDCADQDEVKAAILAATKTGSEVKVSVPMDFSIEVRIKQEWVKPPAKKEKRLTLRQIKEKEDAEREAAESGPEEDTDTGSEGNSSV